jgi:hypothetical protein
MKTKISSRQIVGTVTAVICLLGASPLLRAQPAAAPDALPPNILPASPLAQVVRLMQAGVDESIIMTYVTNSGSTFNLNSDKIIYVKDIGLPNEVVTAMMQRDQQLQQQMTASADQPPAQPAPVPETTGQPETASEPPPVEPPADQTTVVTVNYFYDSLAPYGTWVNVDGYGRCWRPSVVVYNPGWQPYCDHGHWVYTDCGWYWASDYSWGWAPFHYGRWFQVPRWGWCWMPDTIWGPSWVTWRYSNNYCGWAPLPPYAVYREGVGFFYNGIAVSVGFDFGLSWNCFAFVPVGHFCDPHPRRYCVAPAQVTQIYNQTTVINNYNGHGHNLANRGIDPEHIAAVTHTPIHPIAIRDTAAPFGHGSHDQISRDGRTLIVSRPTSMNNPASGGYQNDHSLPSGSPAQNHYPQPNNNWPPAQTQPARQPSVPVITTRNPQERNAISVPVQHPSSTANYNPAPVPPGNRGANSPRGWEQSQPSPSPRPNSYNSVTPAVTPASGQKQSSSPEAGHHNAPAQSQPQHNQPSSAPRSSGQNQNNSGDSGGNSSNSGPGNGSGHGPGH